MATATRTTAGTNQPATWSTAFCTGGFVAWAARTISTMRARTVSEPTRVASIVKEPVPFTVPPVTESPGNLGAGTGSPVSIDSSTSLSPATTRPSRGTRPPGRTRSKSPGSTSATGTVSGLPSTSRSAVSGTSLKRLRRARAVFPRALDSSAWPSATSVITTATAAKKGRPAPAGKSWGAKVAVAE